MNWKFNTDYQNIIINIISIIMSAQKKDKYNLTGYNRIQLYFHPVIFILKHFGNN